MNEREERCATNSTFAPFEQNLLREVDAALRQVLFLAQKWRAFAWWRPGFNDFLEFDSPLGRVVDLGRLLGQASDPHDFANGVL